MIFLRANFLNYYHAYERMTDLPDDEKIGNSDHSHVSSLIIYQPT